MILENSLDQLESLNTLFENKREWRSWAVNIFGAILLTWTSWMRADFLKAKQMSSVKPNQSQAVVHKKIQIERFDNVQIKDIDPSLDDEDFDEDDDDDEIVWNINTVLKSTSA